MSKRLEEEESYWKERGAEFCFGYPLSKFPHFLTSSTFSQLKLLSLMVTSGLLSIQFSGQFLVICHLSELFNILTVPSMVSMTTLIT